MTTRQACCLAEALAAGHAVLRQGGHALIAVERAIRVLEDSGLFNAGRGSKRQLDGVQRMDASLMEGAGLRAGAVASLEGFVHPITAARLVMEETEHVLLAGPMAARFARQFELERHKPPAARSTFVRTDLLSAKNRTAAPWDGRRSRFGSVGDCRLQAPPLEASMPCCPAGSATRR